MGKSQKMSIDIIATVPRRQNVFHSFSGGMIFLLSVSNVESYIYSHVGLYGSRHSLLQRGTTAFACKSLSTPFSSFSLNVHAANSRSSNFSHSDENNSQKAVPVTIIKSSKEKKSGKVERKNNNFVDGLQVKKIRYD